MSRNYITNHEVFQKMIDWLSSNESTNFNMTEPLNIDYDKNRISLAGKAIRIIGLPNGTYVNKLETILGLRNFDMFSVDTWNKYIREKNNLPPPPHFWNKDFVERIPFDKQKEIAINVIKYYTGKVDRVEIPTNQEELLKFYNNH